MKKRILLAEDDANFGLVLKSFLTLHGYEVLWADNGDKAFAAYQQSDFSLCILDVMMPHRDGFSLAEAIRSTGRKTPFVFLTARAMKEDVIKGYQLGAVDYLVKPFDPEILLLKVKALLEHGGEGQAATVFTLGNFTFLYEERLLRRPGAEHKLSPKEAELLRLLILRRGQILSREEALLQLWKEDNMFTAQSMNVYITKLRGYFRQDPDSGLEIENIHSKGFVLREKL